MNRFNLLLTELLISDEYNYTVFDAHCLMSAHADIVAKGIITGDVRATALALSMVKADSSNNVEFAV